MFILLGLRLEESRNQVKLYYVLEGSEKQVKQHFFKVRVFNPNAATYAKLELLKSYKINLKEEKYYNECIMQIEHCSFTRLVMSAIGGMSREFRKF